MTMWVYIALFVVFVLIFLSCNGPEKYAAWVLSLFESIYTPTTKLLKVAYFKEVLPNIKAVDEKRREEGIVRVLEIGSGPGANFHYYPKNFVITALDPNPYFETYFQKNLSQFPDTRIERSIVGVAEDLKEIEDNSMDLVISTIVLCSVQSVEKTLQEVKRVLAPGGKYVFWEHVAAPEGSWLLFWQKFLMYSRIWPFFLDNCQLHRNVSKMVKEAGFSKVDSNHFRIDVSKQRALTILCTHVKGVATK